MSKKCPTCGRDDFKSELGRDRHHAQAHGESLRAKSLTCEWCGDDYEKVGSEAEGSRWCSNECKLAAVHEKRRGSGERVIVECANCGADIERVPCEVSDDNFCDHSCFGEWLSGENHHNWSGGDVEVTCTVCGKSAYRVPNHAEKFDRHFCSPDCHYTWVSENHSGEDHPSWKGGVSYEYPEPWPTQREKALERDGYECRSCGTTQAEHKAEHGRGLDVHHIRPVRTFDDPDDAHAIQNLVTACRSCHTKYEGLPVFPT